MNTNNSTFTYQNVKQDFNPFKTWNQIYSGDFYNNQKYQIQLNYNKLTDNLFLSYKPQFDPLKVYLERYDGTSWTFSSANIKNSYRLAVSNTNIPYVAYTDNYTGINHLKSYAFSEITSPNFGTYLSNAYSDYDMAITSNDERVVVFSNNNSGQITVKKSSGSTWQTLGAEGFTNGSVSYIDIETSAAGEIYVAYIDDLLNKRVIKKYNGSSWDTITEFSNAYVGVPNGQIGPIEMKIGTNNEIFIAYKAPKITVRKYSSGNWQTLGVADLSNNYSPDHFSFALDNQNIPYIAIDKGVIEKFDGSSWVILNKIRIEDYTNFETITDEIKIVIGNDNVPVIVYENNLNVIVAKYIE